MERTSWADFPSEVTLTASEYERARSNPDFFLAVVAGLEDKAGKLRVRFIFDPLGQLKLKIRNDVTLAGVRDAEALEHEFDTRMQEVKALAGLKGDIRQSRLVSVASVAVSDHSSQNLQPLTERIRRHPLQVERWIERG